MARHTTLLVIVFCMALSACAIQRSMDADRARTKMVGMGKEDVLGCMGPPQRKAVEGTTEVWQYPSSDGHSASSSVSTKVPGAANTNTYGYSSHDRSFCTVNIVMRSGLVAAVRYYGPRGMLLAPNEQCGYATEHCADAN